MQLRGFSGSPTPLLIYTTLSSLTLPAMAGSIYVGHSQTEQVSFIGDNTLRFDPGGQSISLSFDITDDLSLSMDYAKLDDDLQPNERVSGEFEIDSWQGGLSYFLDDWSFSLNIANWEDDLNLIARTRNPSRVVQFTEADSYGLSAGYNWYKGNWQWGLSGSVHYNDWEQGEAIGRPDMLPQTSLDSGNATFVSLSLSTAYLVSLPQDRALLFGAGVGYNQLTSSESEAVARNGRNISQINNPSIRSQLNAQNVIGSESYGQVNAYLSYEFAQNWLLDLDASFDFGGLESTTAWSVNLGYLF